MKMKKVKIWAILAGFAVSLPLVIFGAIVIGLSIGLVLDTRGPLFWVVKWALLLGVEFLAGWITGRLSRPYSILNASILAGLWTAIRTSNAFANHSFSLGFVVLSVVMIAATVAGGLSAVRRKAY